LLFLRQPEKLVVSVQTEREVNARYTEVQNEITRLTSFLRQRADSTAAPTNLAQWWNIDLKS